MNIRRRSPNETKYKPWVKDEPKGGVAVRYTWDDIIEALTSKLMLKGDEVVNRLRIDEHVGVTFYIDNEGES